MLGTMKTQRLAAAGVGLLALAIVVTAAVGAQRAALALVGVAAGALLLIMLDLRELVAKSDVRDLLSTEVRGLRKALKAQVGPVAKPVAEISERLREHDERQTQLSHGAVRRITAQTRELEAMFQLFRIVSGPQPLPPMGLWAPDAPSVLNLCALIAKHRPSLTVELGSGSSTVWLGYAVSAAGNNSRLVSFDHLSDYAETTRAEVAAHDLSNIVEVRHAPLTHVDIGDERPAYPWYDREAFNDLSDIDFLFVDGPPGGTRPEAKYPSLPLLIDHLADDAVVVVRDIDASERDKITDRWLAQFPSLRREPATTGDDVVLRRKPS